MELLPTCNLLGPSMLSSCAITWYGPRSVGSSLSALRDNAPVSLRGSRSTRSPLLYCTVNSGCSRSSCAAMMFSLAAACMLHSAWLNSCSASACDTMLSGALKYCLAEVPNVSSTGAYFVVPCTRVLMESCVSDITVGCDHRFHVSCQFNRTRTDLRISELTRSTIPFACGRYVSVYCHTEPIIFARLVTAS